MSYSYSTASLSSFLSTAPMLKYSSNKKLIQSINIKAQSYRDHHHHHHREEPSSSSSRSRNNDIVDTNLSILGARIEEIKVKEKLERCCSSSDKYYGWNNNNNNYEVGSNGNGNYRKRSGHEAPLKQLLELATIVGGTLGFTFFTASLFLCLVSLFVHINQLGLSINYW
ncbi:hypothetical protein CsatA_026330 [Cannabis sativa]